MHVDWLELSKFRSYEQLRWEPDGGVNLLIGENGAGKTNLLEAVSYLAALKSFRGTPDRDLVAEGSPAAVLRGEVSSDVERRSLVEIELRSEGRRRAQLNQKPLRRVGDLLGHMRCVVFQPDDLDVVKRSPSGRRQFLDDLVVQLWPASHQDQREFERAVRQRNTLLRQSGHHVDRANLDVWDERMSQAGAKVMVRRSKAFEMIEDRTRTAYYNVSGVEEGVTFEYRSSWGGSLDPTIAEEKVRAALAVALAGARPADLERRVTTVGPHRDDPVPLLGGVEARTRASQGEQRSLVLALRLAAWGAIADQWGEAPVLLLDDVFSELDAGRSEALAKHLPSGQTFISTARPEDLPVEGRRWIVREGAVL